MNTYAYAHGNPIKYTDPMGLFVIVLPAIPYVAEAIAIVGGIVAGAAVNGATSGSDVSLQEFIEKEANRREYHNRCDEPEPPGLTDPCERAKWQLQKALDCKELRIRMTNRWFGGKEDGAHRAHMAQIENQIRAAERAVKQNCPEKCR